MTHDKTHTLTPEEIRLECFKICLESYKTDNLGKTLAAAGALYDFVTGKYAGVPEPAPSPDLRFCWQDDLDAAIKQRNNAQAHLHDIAGTVKAVIARGWDFETTKKLLQNALDRIGIS